MTLLTVTSLLPQLRNTIIICLFDACNCAVGTVFMTAAWYADGNSQ